VSRRVFGQNAVYGQSPDMLVHAGQSPLEDGEETLRSTHSGEMGTFIRHPPTLGCRALWGSRRGTATSGYSTRGPVTSRSACAWSEKWNC